MMNSLTTMDKILRSVYLDAVTQNLNKNTNLFYNKIEKSSANVYGKEVVATCSFGLNGGVSAVPETSDLPTSTYTDYLNLRAELVNIYGNIEFSDKLVRMSNKGASTPVDIINTELENLLYAARFNLRRMLFQNGSGELATITEMASTGSSLIVVDNTRNLAKGMVIDGMSGDSLMFGGYRIVSIDKATNTIKLDNSLPSVLSIGDKLYMRNSFDSEIFGIPYLFDDSIPTFYGNTRSVVSYAKPIKHHSSYLDIDTMQQCLDLVEEAGTTEPNIILCDYNLRREYFTGLRKYGISIDYAEVDGYKVPVCSGIPICADSFIAPNTGYVLNTDDFVLAQLNDWSWVEGIGDSILQPMANKAGYSATLVKYCNLLCTRPNGQLQFTYEATMQG